MIKCPFCSAKSGKFFSICNHIIACFEQYERIPIYANDSIVNLIKKEGFPLKCLRDFFRQFTEIQLRKVEEQGYEVFYVEDRDSFTYNFHDYLIETSFSEIKLNLRNFYWLLSFLFDKLSPDTIIRPSFEPPWFLNLDINNLPNKFLKDFLKEFVKRKNRQHDVFDKEYMSKERLNFLINNLDSDPGANQNAKDILHDVLSYDEYNYFDFSKWLIKYAKETYDFGSNIFNDLFQELEISEILEFLKSDLEECYVLPTYLNDLMKPFESFNSFPFLEKFIRISRHYYLNPFERPGIVSGLRNFIDELINNVTQKYGIKINKEEKMNKLMERLLKIGMIDLTMKNKLFFIWKQLSTYVHTSDITNKDIKEVYYIRTLLIEDILPKFIKLIA